jgi:hypothetical protein
MRDIGIYPGLDRILAGVRVDCCTAKRFQRRGVVVVAGTCM